MEDSEITEVPNLGAVNGMCMKSTSTKSTGSLTNGMKGTQEKILTWQNPRRTEEVLLKRQEKTDYRFHKEKIFNVSQTQTPSNTPT